MCGLLLSIRIVRTGQDDTDTLFDRLLQPITSRGPDSLGIHVSHVPLCSGDTLEVKLAASVLGLRGDGVTKQPLEDEQCVLGWNGQVFQGLDVGPHENDAAKLFGQLRNGAAPRALLAGIEGPYAFIHLNKRTAELTVQIDPLSRRSLLVHPPDLHTPSERIIVASVRAGGDVGLDMRALDGGEGATLRLGAIKSIAGTLLMHSQEAVETYSFSSKVASPWTRVTPLNTALPPPVLPHPSSEAGVFIHQLTSSVRRRVENIPPPSEEGQSRLAILFSGGVDCTLVAALAHQCLPRDELIDLINVGFQRSPQSQSPSNTETDYLVPDRISGLEAADELRQCCPGRIWRFVEINVPYEESMRHRQKILDLMYPSSTEMDLSLAWPLYFASMGVGTAQTETKGPKTPYKVAPRVYLSGLGADERQLAGYKRHQTAFHRDSWHGLMAELQLDISRLPTRNLSRDDRLISSHARDARFPYLDLSFISYLSSLPVWLKTDPTVLGGDKLLLRLAAGNLGLKRTAAREKRAMQFGTRSAKVGGKGRGAKKGDLQVELFE